MAARKANDTLPKETPEEVEFRKRQSSWEVNQELISTAYFKYILKNKKYPTYTKLAAELKLSERTIRRHLQDTDIFGDMKLKLSALREQSLLAIGIKAIQGKSVAWSKLFHEIVDNIGDEDNKNKGNQFGIISDTQFSQLLKQARDTSTNTSK
jgi:hypothetical protein